MKGTVAELRERALSLNAKADYWTDLAEIALAELARKLPGYRHAEALALYDQSVRNASRVDDKLDAITAELFQRGQRQQARLVAQLPPALPPVLPPILPPLPPEDDDDDDDYDDFDSPEWDFGFEYSSADYGTAHNVDVNFVVRRLDGGSFGHVEAQRVMLATAEAFGRVPAGYKIAGIDWRRPVGRSGWRTKSDWKTTLGDFAAILEFMAKIPGVWRLGSPKKDW